MKAKQKREIIEEYLVLLALVLGIILFFSATDLFMHSLSAEYSVPEEYFRNKIIFGTIYGFIAVILLRKKKLIVKSAGFSGIISILLQVRYYFQGYPKDFVFLFLGIHFVILFALSIIAFSSARKIVS